MTTRVTIEGARRLAAAARLLRGVDRDARRQVNTELRRVLPPMWADAVAAEQDTALDRAVLGGARVRIRATPVLVAGRPAHGDDIWRAVEFGDPNKTYKTYTGNVWRNRNVRIRRRTQEQLPGPARHGRVLYQALRRVGPRVYSLWAQTVIRTVYDALRGGTSG